VEVWGGSPANGSPANGSPANSEVFHDEWKLRFWREMKRGESI
jgi:hypothetical protein